MIKKSFTISRPNIVLIESMLYSVTGMLHPSEQAKLIDIETYQIIVNSHSLEEKMKSSQPQCYAT